ncbi:hypothetical protein, partial [Mycobacterium paraense]|uniref:hypothetical protein n=1 Tax=Mycobacterium paraense TaxID=767916 RepID=UPI00115314AB
MIDGSPGNGGNVKLGRPGNDKLIGGRPGNVKFSAALSAALMSAPMLGSVIDGRPGNGGNVKLGRPGNDK